MTSSQVPMFATRGNGHDSSSSENSSTTKQSIGGYSADHESTMSRSPPVLIDLKRTVRNCHGNLRPWKRRKVSDEEFDAAMARSDIANGGRPYPTISKVRSSVAPQIDISTVHLLHSKSVESSPFLHSTGATVPYDGNLYQDLFCLTQSSYAALVSPQTSLVDDCSSTSSVSDVENSPIPMLTARLDDYLVQEPYKNGKSTTSSQFLSLGDAVECHDSSRIITLANHPFRIIFMNAACEALMGLSCSTTLGKPLNEILTSPSNVLSPESWTSATRRGGVGQGDDNNNNNNNTSSYHIKISPITMSTVGHATHFAVDLTVVGACDGNASLYSHVVG